MENFIFCAVNRSNQSLIQPAKTTKDCTEPSVTFLLYFSGFLFHFILLLFFKYVCMLYFCIQAISKSLCIVYILFFLPLLLTIVSFSTV